MYFWFLFLFVNQFVSPTKSDFLRILFPYISIEVALWLCYYMFKRSSFAYIGTEALLFRNGGEEKYTEEDLDNEDEWVTFNSNFDF